MKNNKNNLLRQFGIIGLGTIVSLLLGLFTTPVITRLVSPESFGKYSLFTTNATLIVSILYLGMDQGLVRYFYNSDNYSYKRELLKKSIGLPLISTSIASVLFIIFFNFSIFGDKIEKTTLKLFIVYIFVLLIKRFSDLIVRLQFNSKLYSFNIILYKIVYLMTAVFLILFTQIKDSYSLIIAVIIASIIIILIGMYSEREIWNLSKSASKVTGLETKILLMYSLPYVFSMAITSLFNANDKLFISYFRSVEELGIFSSATSIIALINVFQTTFNTVWAPAALEHYSNYPEDTEFHRKGNSNITVVMFIVGLTIILLKDIIVIFLGESYREAAFIVPGLVFGPIMYTISETTVSGLVFKEKSNKHIIIAFGSLLVGVVTNLILVPTYGGVGAALASGFSYIIFFTLRTFISNYYFYINFSLNKFYFITFLSFIYAIYASFNSFDTLTIIGYLICIISLIILYSSTFKDIVFKLLNILFNKNKSGNHM